MSYNMSGFERNGDPFAVTLKSWALTAHYALDDDGTLLGFAIVGGEGRGAASKVFVYELHVSVSARRRGIATALLDIAERSGIGRNGPPALELNVHKDNEVAQRFYEAAGFGKSSELQGVLVMRRKRA